MKAKGLAYLMIGVCVLSALLSLYSPGDYLSPGAITADERTGTLYTALETAKAIAVTDLKTGQALGKISLKQNPNNILLSFDRTMLFAATGEENGKIEIITLSKNKVKASIPVGHTPTGMAASPDGKWLYVANRFSNTISVINLKNNKVTTDIPAVREPRSLFVTPDGQTLVAANFLPAQAATEMTVAASITLIDIPTNKIRRQIQLLDGSQSVAGLTGSPDGKYLYAVHILSRYGMPVTQIDRGWVNTNALSIIDIEDASLYATVLLDDVDRGAANPWGLCTNGERLFIALSGTHELMTLDLRGLHDKLATFFSGKLKDAYLSDKESLSRSLSFITPFKKRISLNGRSPRELAIAGGKVYASSHFSPFIEAVSMDGNTVECIMLGNEPAPDAVRRGDLAFCDASICYQQWQSCASCHPDGRADGLNWDQQNDGLGNPKNTKSLLYSHVTPPCMITGIRATAEAAVRNGILHTLQTRQPETLAADMDAYLKNMTPLTSPFLKEYKSKDKREKGKKIFEQAGCLQCHNGQYMTDMNKYNVGTGDGDDAGRAFDTPSLLEVWRTAPYLYDGRAATIREVLTVYNPDDRHGNTKHLSDEDLDALILYINSL